MIAINAHHKTFMFMKLMMLKISDSVAKGVHVTGDSGGEGSHR